MRVTAASSFVPAASPEAHCLVHLNHPDGVYLFVFSMSGRPEELTEVLRAKAGNLLRLRHNTAAEQERV